MDFTKPRVSLYYDILPSTGMRNDGAPLFMSGNFRRILDDVDPISNPSSIAADNGNFVHLSPVGPTSQHGHFDLNVLIDYGEDGLGIPLDWDIPHPNCYWIADSHLGYEYRMNRAKQFDHIFVSYTPTIQKLIADGIPEEKIHYMPWAVEESCYRPFPILEKWDWCFIGHLNNEFRIDLLDRFVKEFGIGDGQGYLGWRIAQYRGHNVLEDTAKKFSQSRIILNESVMDDLNMRTFEGMACRKVMLTEDVPDIHKHFKDGEHLVTYRSIDEAVELAKGLLADPERRNRIAEAGYQEILDKHTYNHRAREILKTCLDWQPKSELKGRVAIC